MYKCIFALSAILLFMSCSLFTESWDYESTQKIAFVKSIISEPERMKEIVENSMYFSELETNSIDKFNYSLFISNIQKIQKNYKLRISKNFMKIQEDGSYLNGFNISIDHSKPNYDRKVCFFFLKTGKNWILKHIYFSY